MTAPLTIIGSASIRSSYLASLAWKETCTVCCAVQLPSRRRGGILVVSLSGSRSCSRLILSKLFVVHIIISLTKNPIAVYIIILHFLCYQKKTIVTYVANDYLYTTEIELSFIVNVRCGCVQNASVKFDQRNTFMMFSRTITSIFPLWSVIQFYKVFKSET